MDFFKSVFSEPTPTPTPSPPASPTTSSWGFGSALFETIASKSESLIDNYYKDLQEFSSGFKKETSVIREAAARAVQELPARLESGAAIAQESLEAVGQAIDNVGSTVSDIIGKDLAFASNDGCLSSRLDLSDDNNNAGISSSRDVDLNFSANAKPYSRIDAMIRTLQCDIRTYIDRVEEVDYSDWELGFRLEEKRDEIKGLLIENSTIAEIYNEIVPGNVDDETFWCRYFYKVDKVVRAEDARLRIVKRAISGEGEEDLSWDVEEDDLDDQEGLFKEYKGKGVVELIERDNGGAGVSGEKGEVVVVDDESLRERLVVDHEREASEGKPGSDFSIVSSQREDDLGWDEIEDIRSGDESNGGDRGSSGSGAAVEVKKRLSGGEEDEDLSWDIEEDVEAVKL